MALAASLVNPREFELPRELRLPITFPGTDKIDVAPIKRGRQQGSACNGKSHCLDSALMVPLPARLCFECGKSCKRAPLIACDYCPLFFHQDCLDPPLTAFPSGRWMCPNHPNHFIDQNLLRSCNATERIKLWDQFATRRIDPQAVKLEFLRKTYSPNPPFRVKLTVNGRAKVKVPEIVKCHYAKPTELNSIHTYRRTTFIRPYYETTERRKNDELNGHENYSENNCSNDKTTDNENLENHNDTVEKMDIDIVTIKDKPCEDTVNSRKSEKDMKKDETRRREQVGCMIKEGIQLLERPVLEALAQQRLEQILNPLGEDYEPLNKKSEARAALFPLSRKPGPPALMIRRTLTIGTGANCDVALSRYGNCECISSKHAVIFFDDTTKRYELLNYSEYGTTVDNVFYSCDCTSLTTKKGNDNDEDLLPENWKPYGTLNNTTNNSSRLSISKRVSCKCSVLEHEDTNEVYTQAGWEGSAIVAHGSILTFGCLVFVFSTVAV